jgi:hypothetical protein
VLPKMYLGINVPVSNGRKLNKTFYKICEEYFNGYLEKETHKK